MSWPAMTLSFSAEGWEDYTHWIEQDRKVVRRINALIKDIARAPFEGIGKPEPLKHQLSGYWSRRITEEDRLVYRVQGDTLAVIQCRGHY